MALSISQLSKYLSGRDFGTSMKLTWHANQENDQDLLWKGQDLPWNGLSCLSVVCYALKFCSESDHKDVFDTIKRLNDLAIQYKTIKSTSSKLEKELVMAETFVNGFVPKAEKFFTLQKRDEHVAGFIHFLLQILNSETNIVLHHETSFPIDEGLKSLHEGLTFLLAVIGDTPFQHIEHQEVKNLLTEFEAVANEAGSNIYSCVFRICPSMKSKLHRGFFALFHNWSRMPCTCPVDITTLSAGISDLLTRINLLKEKIKWHCLEFSEPVYANAMNTDADAPDSLFIVESLLEDLENFNNHRQDNLTVRTVILREEFWYAARFLKRIGNEITVELKQCVVQIRDVAYEAEYLINSFVARNFPDWYAFIRLRKVIGKLKNVNALCKQCFERIERSNLVEDVPVIERSNLVEDVPVNDNIVVGFERETDAILRELVGGSENLEIISIFGMPGIGKTTLAKKLYNHRSVTDYFYKSAWCVVSQTYSKKKVLTDILLCLQDHPGNISNMDEGSLIQQMHQSLIGNRYLIVIDDVWDSDTWNDLGRFFPRENQGSRILFTTRIQELAPTIGNVHTLPLLEPDQCWELFEKKVFGDESSCPQQLLQVGKEIAAKCKGLPLALVVVAGMLANMAKERVVWEQVEQSFQSSDIYTSHCQEIMENSYKHLPNHLKLCFLYFGVFPEDEEIPVRKLIWLWIAEGLIQKDENKNPEDVAKEYLVDLIHRGLVLVAEKGSTGGVKSCSMHDLLRDMCLKRAEKENFMGLIKKEDNYSIYKNHHRLRVDVTAPPHSRPFSVKCRSFFGGLSDPSSCIPQMKHMRVVEVSPNDKLKKIELFVHLRYLVVYLMPPSQVIANLVNLEVLCVDNDPSEAVYIPPVLLKMVKLRHLRVDFRAQFEDECDSSHPNNLQSLSNLHIYLNDTKVLISLPNLRKLKCLCPRKLPNFCVLTKLESLRIGVHDTSEKSMNYTDINFPLTIKRLCLFRTNLPWDKMYILGRLPKLEVLKLLWEAFQGEKWETVSGEFPKLRFLKLAELNLTEWVASDEHFPKLNHLVLHKCRELKGIPTDLGHIAGLRMIEAHDCSKGVSESARQIEKEQRDDYGNEELTVLIIINQIRAKSKWRAGDFPEPEYPRSYSIPPPPDFSHRRVPDLFDHSRMFDHLHRPMHDPFTGPGHFDHSLMSDHSHRKSEERMHRESHWRTFNHSHRPTNIHLHNLFTGLGSNMNHMHNRF